MIISNGTEGFENLKKLVDFESNCTELIIDEADIDSIEFLLRRKNGLLTPTSKDEYRRCSLFIKINGVDFIYENLNNQFLFQIVSHYYYFKNPYSDVEVKNKVELNYESDNLHNEKLTFESSIDRYKNNVSMFRNFMLTEMESDIESFVKFIKNIISTKKIIYRKFGEYIIYGFVSVNYVNTDQLKFREYFLKYLSNAGLISQNIISKIYVEYDRVCERLLFDLLQNKNIKIYCKITYGKNNGFGSYYVEWIRYIDSIESNMATITNKDKYNWKNSNKVFQVGTIDDFCEFTAKEGIKTFNNTIDIVKKSIDSMIGKENFEKTFWNVLDRAYVAKASKERCIEAFNNLIFDENIKYSEWSICSSIIYVANFKNGIIPKSMTEVLLATGTILAEMGYDEFKDKVKPNSINYTYY